jgi:plasmid stabilization system protein ParE
MKIVILRSAIEDLVRGREFYEKQDEGLGAYFEDSLAADIESLRLFAGIHHVMLGYHRMLSTKFPYAVYYEIVGEQIRIRAVLDCRRDPKWIHTRLQR